MREEAGVVGSWEPSRVELVQELGPGQARRRVESSRAVKALKAWKLGKLWLRLQLQLWSGEEVGEVRIAQDLRASS